MSWLSSFMHPGRGYDKAQGQLDKYYGQAGDYYNQAQGYQQPYNQQGQAQYGNLSDIIKSLGDPQALQDKWASGYKESEAAKNAEGMAQQHGLDAASSMGLMGSTPALSAIQAGTSQIGAEDRQNYLNDLMQKYMAGAGISQGLYNTGAGAAGQMGQNAMGMGTNAMNMGQNSAQMSYGKQNAGGSMLGNLIGTAAGLGGSYLAGQSNPKNWSFSGGR
jgi:hypothetical protein